MPGPLTGLPSTSTLPEVCGLQSRDQVQQRGLAASRRSDDAEKFSRLHLKIDVVERQQPLS